jgi:hypothetical protein
MIFLAISKPRKEKIKLPQQTKTLRALSSLCKPELNPCQKPQFGAARIFAYGMAAKATLAQAKDH